MSNIQKVLYSEIIDHPMDVQTLRGLIPYLKTFSDYQIEKLYSAFSDEVCASWLILDEDTARRFELWLTQ